MLTRAQSIGGNVSYCVAVFLYFSLSSILLFEGKH